MPDATARGAAPRRAKSPVCPVCGAQNEPDGLFCAECGASLALLPGNKPREAVPESSTDRGIGKMAATPDIAPREATPDHGTGRATTARLPDAAPRGTASEFAPDLRLGRATPAPAACPACGAANVEGDLFCGFCGARLFQGDGPSVERERIEKPKPDLRRCPHCGAATPSDDEFCCECGQNVYAEPGKRPKRGPARCPRCGTAHAEGAAQCAECGALLAPAPGIIMSPGMKRALERGDRESGQTAVENPYMRPAEF